MDKEFNVRPGDWTIQFISWTSVRIELYCVRRIREWTFDQGPWARSTTSRQDLCRCLGWNVSQGTCWPGGIPLEHRKQDPVNKDAVKSSSIIGSCHEDKWGRRRYIDSINCNGLCYWWPGCCSCCWGHWHLRHAPLSLPLPHSATARQLFWRPLLSPKRYRTCPT